MAVREFTDREGIEWRVWDVRPEHMHPVTRGEDYMSVLQDGWLAFESGTEKRRLEAPYPANWTAVGIPALEALCHGATPVVRRTPQSDTGKQRAVHAAETEQKAIRGEAARRVFLSPGGREWTVRVHECLDSAGKERTVLRFTAGDIVVDLPRWSERWRTSTMEEFGVMLLDANPPRRLKSGEGPQRRHEDRAMLDSRESASTHAVTDNR